MINEHYKELKNIGEHGLIYDMSIGYPRGHSFESLAALNAKLDHLERNGWVEHVYPNDKQGCLYKLTPAGKQAIIDYENARKEGIEAVYREMYK